MIFKACKMATSLDDELKCGICLELFQDPRSLPCLHTFCLECIQRSLNKENRSLKCSVCRAKHELGQEGARLLPVNEYARQELPQRRLLQEQLEKNGGKQRCKSCDDQAPLVAWCKDCDAMICQPCVNMHKKMASLREHRVVQGDKIGPKSEKRIAVSVCLKHTGQELKYYCKLCSEVVCPECLLFEHKDHQFNTVKETRHSLNTKMKDLASLVAPKKKEFSKYLEKASKAEGDALEYSELMKSEVNNVFDAIAASVEAQRNEALQSVSQGVKKIWAQKEKMEVSLAQLDSFTRFADHTHKCTGDASFVAMATQSIKLMKRLKDIRGEESALVHEFLPLGSRCSEAPLHVPLDGVFTLGQPLYLKFSPGSGSDIDKLYKDGRIKVTVSLMVGDLPVLYHSGLRDRFELVVKANRFSPKVKLKQSRELSWEVTDSNCKYNDLTLEASCSYCAKTIATGSSTYEVEMMFLDKSWKTPRALPKYH